MPLRLAQLQQEGPQCRRQLAGQDLLPLSSWVWASTRVPRPDPWPACTHTLQWPVLAPTSFSRAAVLD